MKTNSTISWTREKALENVRQLRAAIKNRENPLVTSQEFNGSRKIEAEIKYFLQAVVIRKAAKTTRRKLKLQIEFPCKTKKTKLNDGAEF